MLRKPSFRSARDIQRRQAVGGAGWILELHCRGSAARTRNSCSRHDITSHLIGLLANEGALGHTELETDIQGPSFWLLSWRRFVFHPEETRWRIGGRRHRR